MVKSKFFKSGQKIVFVILIVFLFCGCNYTNKSENLSYKLYNAIGMRNFEAAKEAIEEWKSEGYDIKELTLPKKVSVWDMSKVDSPLIAAMFEGLDNIEDYLLEQDIDVNCIGSNGKSLLIYSIENDNRNIEKIIEKGADVNYISKEGKTVLDIALDYGDKSTIYPLLKSNDIIVSNDVIYNYINTLRNSEEYYTGYGFLKELLQHNKNANIDIYNSIFNSDAILEGYNKENEEMIILCTAAFGKTNVLKYLMDNNEYNINKLYMLACEYGNISNIEYLLSLGVDINNSDKKGVTAIERAMENDLCDTVIYLLQKGASTRGEKGTNYDDILCYAVYNNNYDITKLLIDKYNDNLNMDRALAAAAMYGYNSALKAFLDTGTNANYIINDCSLVELACLSSDGNEAVKLLLERGANVNEINGRPLINAVQYGNIDIVETLINYNVDVIYNISNNGDQTDVLYYASTNGYFDIVRDLVEYGATFTDYKAVSYGLERIKLSDNIYNYLLNKKLL